MRHSDTCCSLFPIPGLTFYFPCFLCMFLGNNEFATKEHNDWSANWINYNLWYPMVSFNRCSGMFCIFLSLPVFSLRKRKTSYADILVNIIYEYSYNLKFQKFIPCRSFVFAVYRFAQFGLVCRLPSLGFSALDYYSLRALNQTYIGAKRESWRGYLGYLVIYFNTFF